MLTTVHEALARLAAVSPLNRTEVLPLDAALGRVLAEPVCLEGDQPPFDRVTMDGFAVRLPGGPSFRIVAEIAAGQTFSGTLAPGEAVRIMTGAPAPQGTTVVPLEATDGGPQGVVTVTGPVAPGRNIAWRGEDGRTGTILLTPGTRLAPVTLALAALAGIALRLAGATLGAINEIPLLGGLLELVGLVALLNFLARNAFKQQKRAELLERIRQLRKNLIS